MRKIIWAFVLTFLCFVPFNVALASEYEVYHIDNTGAKALIASPSSYEEALKIMNEYKSTLNDVAVITRNGRIVNAMYGVFRFNSASTVTFQSAYGSRYVSPSYDSEAVLLGYDPGSDTVQFKISGVIGNLSSSMGNVQPISFLTSGGAVGYDPAKTYLRVIASGGLRLREGEGTNTSQIGCQPGVISCAASQGGKFASEGGIYEWLNKGEVKNVGGYEWYKINMDGNIGYIAHDPNDPYVTEFLPAIGSKEDYQTYYSVTAGGILYHTFYMTAASSNVSSVSLGLAPRYLKANQRYYSYDGVYFYDDFTKMVADYRHNTYKNAVNKYPYYNYYQYMPSRTMTVYNADNINQYLIAKHYYGKINRDEYYTRYWDAGLGKYKWQLTYDWDNFAPNLSMLYDEGATFINSQTLYGVNAAQTFALSINESAWGRSYISVREYNIFGHGAYDSNPDAYATGYNTVADGIMAHAYKYIARDYDNPVSGSHYNGGHYGNKLSGNNVSYASDAYWGEKMAGQYAAFDGFYDYQEFKNKLKIGIKEIDSAVAVRKDPNTSATIYYYLKNLPNIPVTILDEVHGESIDGNDIWYKIQSDIPIDENRNPLDINTSTYNFETSYAYVHSSYFYVESQAPIITASDVTLINGTKFDATKEASAYDPFDGPVAVKVTSNDVNPNIAGTYHVTYEATDLEGHTSSLTISVNVVNDSKPVINVNNQEILLNSAFDPLKIATAFDLEDGDITDKLVVTYKDVKTDTVGTYKVSYKVTDKTNNTTTKDITVKVIAASLTKKDAIFYFEYLKNVNGKLELKGYNTINGIDNTLAEAITYEVQFKNIETGKVITQKANRITDTKAMTRPVFGLDDKDYTYSWFVLDIDLKNLDEGNYQMTIISRSSKYESASIVSNKLYKEQVTSFNGDKYVITKNNFDDKNGPVELIVRKNLLASKSSSAMYNQYDTFRTFEFTNNKLHLKGTSYSYGMDLSSAKAVTRQIIFENMNTYQTYRFNLDSITDGLYQVVLPVEDNLKKERAWYDASIDLSNLPVGKYVIYITTTSNITDIAEFTEKLNRDSEIAKVTATINKKKYSFSVNHDRGNRIELTITNA